LIECDTSIIRCSGCPERTLMPDGDGVNGLEVGDNRRSEQTTAYKNYLGNDAYF
jgi:hypothetical protein